MIKTIPLPSKERLDELFEYDPTSGLVKRKIRVSNQPVGSIIKSKTMGGYYGVTVDFTKYRLHRLIWMMMTGEDPGEFIIDHEDRNRTNNKWSNLRLAKQRKDQDSDYIHNCDNRSLYSSSSTGHNNIYWDQRGQRYIVRGFIDGKRCEWGSSEDLDEAIAIQERGKLIKVFHIVDANGIEYQTTNLSSFCRDNNINYKNLNYKGSKGYKLTKTTTQIIK